MSVVTDRDARLLREAQQLLGRLGLEHAAAHVEHGLPRGGDELRGLADLLAVRPDRRPVAGQLQLRGPGERRLLLQDVLRDVHQHRAGSARGREVERLAIALGISAASVTSVLCLVIGMVMPVMSASWNASVPMSGRLCWPVIATTGIESMWASAIGVTRLVGPRPGRRHADPDLAGGLRVTRGRVPRALLVADEDVPDPRGVQQWVVGGEDRAAGDAEDDLAADLLQRADERLRPGHGDVVVAVSGHGLGARGHRGLGRGGPSGRWRRLRP
jgi:hypothetical protein